LPDCVVTSGWLNVAMSSSPTGSQPIAVDFTVVTATRGLPRTRTRNVWPIGTWPVIEPWSTTTPCAPGVSACIANLGTNCWVLATGRSSRFPHCFDQLTPVLLLMIHHVPVEARQMAISVRPSPS
jgi:hypothetical protein